MQRKVNPKLSVAVIFGTFIFSVSSTKLFAQSAAIPNTQAAPSAAPAATAPSPVVTPPWPELRIPTTHSIEELTTFISETKALQPTTPDRYRDMQKAIHGASRRILELTNDRSSPAFKAVEFDYYSSSVMLLGNEGPEAQRRTYERFRDYVNAKPKPDENDLKMILLTGQNLEQIPDGKLAREAYQEFSKILKKKKDESLKFWIEMMDANARRVELPGKQMVVTGKTITGADFDIQSCRGKVTLVYFWASWEASVKHEYQYMRKLYLDFREKGFEIVAISVDEDREKLESFIRENEIPWIHLWDEENRSSPVAVQQYGISAIPTMILLDREGKVISMEARGLLLGKLLEKHIDGVPPPQTQKASPKSQ